MSMSSGDSENQRSSTPMDQEHLRESVKRTSSHLSPGGPSRQLKIRTTSPPIERSVVPTVDRPPAVIEDDAPVAGPSQQPLPELTASPKRAITTQVLQPLEYSTTEFPVMPREEYPVERQQGIVPSEIRGRGVRRPRARGQITSSRTTPPRRRGLLTNWGIFPQAYRRVRDENLDDTL